ncbi:MAG TPA: arsinothricin resistance N-acetyltransferase ArsN1 family B [Thermoanaerobaculia bacterium]|nr:arsinothricin resistance N-acetyltransferase ArsN1 family B [Thermoanaerobaculia bacterium]
MGMVLRLAEPADAAGILAIYAPIVRETAISFELEPPSEEEMRRRIETTLERRPWLVCAAGGAVAGYAYAAAHRERPAYQWSVETSVYVHPDHQRRGVARGLYAALLAALRAQGFANALAGIALPNPASVGFHEACGFQWIGVYHSVGHKIGAWHDVAWLELRLREAGDTLTPPCRTAELMTRPEWQAALQAGLSRLR